MKDRRILFTQTQQYDTAGSSSTSQGLNALRHQRSRPVLSSDSVRSVPSARVGLGPEEVELFISLCSTQ